MENYFVIQNVRSKEFLFEDRWEYSLFRENIKLAKTFTSYLSAVEELKTNFNFNGHFTILEIFEK